tara:strand:+ start:188 stop:412 length:225 start_codon:yes stop_codon:yes gene_type:complete
MQSMIEEKLIELLEEYKKKQCKFLEVEIDNIMTKYVIDFLKDIDRAKEIVHLWAEENGYDELLKEKLHIEKEGV